MQKIFILGNPRSGTSLFRLMLNAHSEIIAPPECGFLQWWFKKYNGWDSKASEAKVEEFISDLKTSKKIETWNLDYDSLKEDILEDKPKNYADLTTLVYLSYAKHKGKNIKTIVDKNNYYVYHLALTKKIWKKAKFIFMIRDGRDVACSYKALRSLDSKSPYKPHLPYQILEIAKEWNWINSEVMQFLNNLPKEEFIIIRYEDLILVAERELMKICAFIGIKYQAEMLLYFQENQEPLSTLDWKRKTLEKPDQNNIGKYKQLLNEEEVKVFNNVNKELLLKFGYKL